MRILRNSTMPDWDQIFSEKGHVFTDPHSDIERVVELIIEGNHRRILDLGCGTGRHVVYFAGLGFEVYGFDASTKALSMTQEWLQEKNLTADLREHLMRMASHPGHHDNARGYGPLIPYYYFG